jgi:hypothetical protein
MSLHYGPLRALQRLQRWIGAAAVRASVGDAEVVQMLERGSFEDAAEDCLRPRFLGPSSAGAARASSTEGSREAASVVAVAPSAHIVTAPVQGSERVRVPEFLKSATSPDPRRCATRTFGTASPTNDMASTTMMAAPGRFGSVGDAARCFGALVRIRRHMHGLSANDAPSAASHLGLSFFATAPVPESPGRRGSCDGVNSRWGGDWKCGATSALRAVPWRDPISICFSPLTCCSRKAALRARLVGCGSVRRQ